MRSGGRLLAFVSAVVFVDTTVFGVIAPLLPYYTAELALSKAEAGILVAAFPAGVIAGAFPAASLVTRVGVRRVTVMGLVALAWASLVFGFAESLVLLVLARFAQGAASAATWTASLAWLARETPAERRGERLGTAFSAAVVGALLGPALGAAARGTDPAAVFAFGALAGLAMAAWATRMSEPRGEAGEGRLSTALRSPSLLPGMLVILLVGLFFGVVEVLVPLQLDALGAGGVAIAGAFALTSLGQAIAGPRIGRVSDRAGAHAPVAVSLCLGAILAALMPLPESVVLLAVLLVLCGPVGGGLFVPGMKLLADGAEAAGLDQAYGFAIFNLTWALTTAAGAFAAGAVAEVAGDTAAYLALAGVMALAFTASALVSSGSSRSSGRGPSPSSPSSPSARTR